MDYNINDIVYMKKSHPCGNNNFKVLRIGADFKLQCCKCERIVMLPRTKFTKMAKKIVF